MTVRRYNRTSSFSGIVSVHNTDNYQFYPEMKKRNTKQCLRATKKANRVEESNKNLADEQYLDNLSYLWSKDMKINMVLTKDRF